MTRENKEKVRLRILAGAAKLFREYGYRGVNIDTLMREAHLTRGAFYAHFESKIDLFKAVVRDEHPLLRMLLARKGQAADALWEEMLGVFEGYLTPSNLKEVYTGCTLASLTGEVARAPDLVKQAYDAAWSDIRHEMSRGQDQISDPTQLHMALVLAVGAVNMAAASADPQQQSRILIPAWQTFRALAENARGSIGEK